MSLRIFVTQGATADCAQAGRLIEGIDADHLLADRGYDSNVIIEQAKKQEMGVVISPTKNRKIQRPYDKALYKLRHLVENAFLHLKRWRGIEHDTLKIQPLFSLPYKFDVSPMDKYPVTKHLGINYRSLRYRKEVRKEFS